MIFYTADQHFGHTNIIKYCKRPWATSEEVDALLIERWNEVVGPDDTVFHLGDFALCGKNAARSYFEQLNGTIFILANRQHHDYSWLPVRSIDRWGRSAVGTPWIHFLPPLYTHNPLDFLDTVTPLIVLCHYPLQIWDRKYYGAWHLHGHSHGKLPRIPGRMDVGVDAVPNYAPISLDEVIKELSGEH